MQKSTDNSRAPGSDGPGYETHDVDVRAAAIFGVTLFAVLVVVVFAMRGLFGYFENTQQLGPETTPFKASRELPPAPRLQVDPKQDLARTREEQQQLLESYGWADQGTEKFAFRSIAPWICFFSAACLCAPNLRAKLRNKMEN